MITDTALVGVFAGGYSRQLDTIHARLAGLVGDGRLRTRHRRGAFDELPGAVQRMADRAVIGKPSSPCDDSPAESGRT